VADLRTPDVIAFWSDFCARKGVDPRGRWDVFAFGDSPELADELGALVVDGPKRATAGLSAQYDLPDADPLPEVGAYSVVVGGRGQPLAVIRTTEVTVKPMSEVDDAFAWDEGEGDRSLAYWMRAHRAFFTRQLAAHGESFQDDMLVVLERFQLSWPTESVRTPER